MIRLHILILSLLIAALAPFARADEIALTSGETLSGAIIERTAEYLILDHPILGELRIHLSDISTINGREVSALPFPRNPPPEPPVSPPAPPETPPSVAPELPAGVPPIDTEKPPPPEPPSPPLPEEPSPEWKSQFETGVSAASGTTDNVNFRLSVRAALEKPSSTFRFDSTYRFTESQSARTENRFTAGTFSEWRKPETEWNAFLQFRFDADEFQSWNQRVSTAGGFGYRLFDIKDNRSDGTEFDLFQMTVRLGGGFRREFGSLNPDLAPEGLLGAEFTWNISEKQRLSGGTTFYPDLNEPREFRLNSNFDWTITIDEFDGVNLKFGLSHEYESKVDPGIDHNDLSVYATLVVDF